MEAIEKLRDLDHGLSDSQRLKIADLIEEQRELLVKFGNAFDAGYAAAKHTLAERAGGVKVPIGYALVPVEPTDRMVSAYVAAKPKGAGFNHPRKGDDKKAWFAAHEKKCRERWKAMLSVSALTEPATPSETVIRLGADCLVEANGASLNMPLVSKRIVITDNVSPYSYQIRASPGTVLRCCTINGKSFCNDPDCDVHAGDTVTPTHREPRAYIVHAPEDDYYGTWPGRLQFHPLSQRDLDNGYRQTPLFTRPAEQAVTEAMVEAAANQLGFGSADSVRIRAALKAAMEAGRHG